MAKETMQAVSDAEKNARQTILHAKEESERLLREAEERGAKLIADAEKDAVKKVGVLCGVAKADAEKLKARAFQETEKEQARLREAAAAALPEASKEIKKFILGQDRAE